MKNVLHVPGEWCAEMLHPIPISARPRKTPDVSGGMSVSAITSPERVGRTRSRIAGVSQSQRKLLCM